MPLNPFSTRDAFAWAILAVTGASVVRAQWLVPRNAASSSSAVLTKHELKAADAVCNDASPAVLYHAAGDPLNWLVYLQGGGWCYDEQTCAERFTSSPQLMSSTSYSATISLGGIFSTNPAESPITNYTKV